MLTLTVKKLSRLEASIGLIGKREPEPVLFKTHFGIHTFFLNFPIDIIILDSKHRVVKIKKGLKPNSMFVWNPLHNTVLELPQGTISEKKIELGKRVSIEER